MKRLRSSALLMYLEVFFCFFIAGLLYASWIEAGKGQGLAAGAIVLSYGVGFAVVAFIISIVAAGYLKQSAIIRINWVLGGILIILILLVYFQQKSKNDTHLNPELGIHDEHPVKNPFTRTVSLLEISDNLAKEEKSLGFFKPDFKSGTVYFYNNPFLKANVAVSDSLVFSNSKSGTIEISYAPPWFAPEHLKMDYQIMWLKCIAIGKDLIKVETNKYDGKTLFMKKSIGELFLWPEFLLHVHSIEPLNKSIQKLHIKPLAHSSEVKTSYSFLRVLLIQGDWVYTELISDQYEVNAKAWLKWREGNTILIQYSLLS